MAAIDVQDGKLIKQLLDARPKDFDVDGMDEQGYVPLSLAVVHGDDIVIGLLLANGAVPTRRDSKGKRAFDYADSNEVLLQLLRPGRGQTASSRITESANYCAMADSRRRQENCLPELVCLYYEVSWCQSPSQLFASLFEVRRGIAAGRACYGNYSFVQ